MTHNKLFIFLLLVIHNLNTMEPSTSTLAPFISSTISPVHKRKTIETLNGQQQKRIKTDFSRSQYRKHLEKVVEEYKKTPYHQRTKRIKKGFEQIAKQFVPKVEEYLEENHRVIVSSINDIVETAPLTAMIYIGTVQDKLGQACKIGDTTILQSLLTSHPTTLENQESVSYLFNIAAANRQFSIIQTLLNRLTSASTSFNKSNINCTPLHYATYAGSVDIVKYLLQNGFPVEHRGTFNAPPIFWAIEYNKKYIVSLLIQYKANVNAVNLKTGETPLHVAVKKQNDSIIKKLQKAGADPQIKDYKGLIPSFYYEPQEISLLNENQKPIVEFVNSSNQEPKNKKTLEFHNLYTPQ